MPENKDVGILRKIFNFIVPTYTPPPKIDVPEEVDVDNYDDFDISEVEFDEELNPDYVFEGVTIRLGIVDVGQMSTERFDELANFISRIHQVDDILFTYQFKVNIDPEIKSLEGYRLAADNITAEAMAEYSRLLAISDKEKNHAPS